MLGRPILASLCPIALVLPSWCGGPVKQCAPWFTGNEGSCIMLCCSLRTPIPCSNSQGDCLPVTLTEMFDRNESIWIGFIRFTLPGKFAIFAPTAMPCSGAGPAAGSWTRTAKERSPLRSAHLKRENKSQKVSKICCLTQRNEGHVQWGGWHQSFLGVAISDFLLSWRWEKEER
jgi:hypothetical protein